MRFPLDGPPQGLSYDRAAATPVRSNRRGQCSSIRGLAPSGKRRIHSASAEQADHFDDETRERRHRHSKLPSRQAAQTKSKTSEEKAGGQHASPVARAPLTKQRKRPHSRL